MDPKNTTFEITGPGIYKDREGNEHRIIPRPQYTHDVYPWVCYDTDRTFTKHGRYYEEPDRTDPWDLIELVKLDEPAQVEVIESAVGKGTVTDVAKEYIKQGPLPITEYDRRMIAAQMAQGLLAGGHAAYNEGELKADQLVTDAVILTDKLLARIRETQQ